MESNFWVGEFNLDEDKLVLSSHRKMMSNESLARVLLKGQKIVYIF
jgi:hypothetical protein